MTNTLLHLMYRDACNYKAWSSVVFEGPPTPELVARLMASLDEGEYIVAEQVGLVTPARENATFAGRYPDGEDDHGYTEIHESDIEATNESASAGPFAGFVERCEAAAADGWDTDLAIEAAGGWTDPDLAAALRNGTGAPA